MNDVLSRFREAGMNGLEWHEAVDLVDPSLSDETDPATYDPAAEAYEDGLKDRARQAVEASIAARADPVDPFIPWRVKEVEALAEPNWLRSGPYLPVADVELTTDDGEHLIEIAAQAARLEPDQLVAIVAEFAPLPEHAPRIAEIALNDFQGRPVGPAKQPAKVEPLIEQHRPLTAAEAQAEISAAVASRREAAGLPPLPMLRSVDYEAGCTYLPPSWRVKNLIPERGLGMLFGPSSAGKTFLAIHTALCVAWGVPFFRRKVKPGAVLYIAAEGGSSVLPRFDAAEKALGIGAANLAGQRDASTSRAPIRVVTEAPNLSRDGDPAPLIRTIRAYAAECERQGFPLALVVVDTLHASLGGGDENSAADMGHALKPLKDAVEELGLYALILHHPGKDAERGARGSGSLLAAVDTSIELCVIGSTGQGAKPAGMTRCATINKQRDGAVGDALHYRLPIVTIGTDEDGDPWTTCTVQPCDAPALNAAGKPKGKGDRRFAEALDKALAECGGERAELRILRGFFNNAGEPGESDDTRRKAWDRAFAKAREAGEVELDTLDQFIWRSPQDVA